MKKSENYWLLFCFSVVILLLGYISFVDRYRNENIKTSSKVIPKIVVTKVEREVTPVSDLIAQVVTYRITLTETFEVHYIPAEDVFVDGELLLFIDKDSKVVKSYPTSRVWNLKRFNIGEKW